MTSPVRGMRRLAYAGLTAVLLAAGIALLAASCSGSRPGPPLPPGGAAGDTTSTTAAPATAAPPTSHRSAGTSSDAPRTAPRHASRPGTTAAAGPDPTNRTAPTPPSPTATTATTATATAGIHTTARALAPSPPVSLSIPALNVSSALVRLGLNSDGTVQVPDLNDPDSKAGWYEHSPTPGALGPSIILGHIDSRKYGPGVFYRLGDLRPGDTVAVARADGTLAVFRVDRVRIYPKDQFPTLAVYGNIDYAGLRLITCGGIFNPSERSYESNIVAYATLASFHPGN